MICRPAEIADIPSIQAVAEAGWLATYLGIFTEAEIRERLADWYSAESLERCCTDRHAVFLVAEDKGEIVGYGHYGQRNLGPQLFRLYARPARWRSGVGSTILDHLEERLRKWGVREYCCRVHRRNEIGKAFYDRRGFAHHAAGDDAEHHFLIRKLDPHRLPVE
jgi:GNAT superfamily N-acetyltransferase